ncbi:RNA polymerase sigma factor [Marimonas sp. MJW-29]|uniref:RNA polymerase sigma factor n=1 Tax=Sulfitobacter sediminis TaxID=3234186 RepID=A0ABV3RRM4_9RHOB
MSKIERKDGPGTLSDLMPKLLRRARRLSARSEEAEDMAQETALRLWQVLVEKRRIEAPERYAMTMLRNIARQRWRGRQVTEELTEDMVEAAPLAPARIACAELCAAIDRLPEDQALLMRLVMGGETSPQVLARRLGLPVGTVMSRLGRARARLRVEIGLEGSVVELL